MTFVLVIVSLISIVLKDCFVWLMDHVRNNVILIFIVPKVKYVSVMEVANIRVRKKMAVHLVNIVIWIIRFATTFVLLTSLVIQDTNVTTEPVTNNVVRLTIVVMINIVQSEFYVKEIISVIKKTFIFNFT